VKRLFVDLESYSDAPIAEVGAYRYAQDPSTRVLLFGCAWDDGPVDLTDLAHGERLPADVRQALTDPAVQKWAHNAAFERAILEHVLEISCDPAQWRCTMVWAQTLSLPAGLAELAKELKLTAQKLDPDKRLVERFCTPRGRARQRRLDDAEAWEQFKEYCARDVRVCRDVTTALAAYPVPGAEWRLWALDQRINDRGLPIDTALVSAAQRAADAHSAAVMTQAREDTGVDNPGSRAQLLAWLAEQGVEVEDLRAGTVESLLKGELTPEVRQVLEHRQQLAATSVAKYDVLARATWEGRLRGTFQFYGANRTGRWSGRLFQPHNLTRGKLKSVTDLATARDALLGGDLDWLRTLFGDDVTGVLSSLIRTAIAAPPGQQLVVADYASIESVMLAWAARSSYLLDLFRAGRDPYKDFATHLFHKDYAAVTKVERNLAKPATLGCFAADTRVLTSRGWLPIVQVGAADRVWDGTAWVVHGGVIAQGAKRVIEVSGVRVTPDHQVFMGETECRAAEEFSKSTDLFPLALAWARSRLPAGASEGAARSSATSLSALAAQRLAPPRTTFAPGAPRGVRAAQSAPRAGRKSAGLSSSRIVEFVMHGVRGTRRCLDAAMTRAMPAGRATVAAASSWWRSGMTEPSSWLGWPGSPGTRIFASSLTGSTTTVLTLRGTVDWSRAPKTPATPDRTATSSTKAAGTPSRSFGTGLRRAIARFLPSGGSSIEAPRLPRSSRTNAAAAVPTYDIRDAGPRHRFTILTDAGPLIVHNCGYGLGAAGLQRYAMGFGQVLDEAEARRQVGAYREAYPDIPRFWADVEAAALAALQTGESARVGAFTFRTDGTRYLFVDLPAGRALAYYRPKVEREGRRLQITYEGREVGKRARVGTHPGKLVENLVQAIARDVLAAGLLMTAQDPGLKIVGHVHDEILCLADADDAGALDRLKAAMRAPDWCPDAPVRAEGWCGPWYRKD
jgi:DNA polymerase